MSDVERHGATLEAAHLREELMLYSTTIARKFVVLNKKQSILYCKHVMRRSLLKSTLLLLTGYALGATCTHLAGAHAESDSPYGVLRRLAESLVLIENEYVEPVERERLLEGALEGMVAELDPHSSYLTKERYARLRSDTEGAFGGIGVEVDLRNEQVIVIAPIEGSPADQAGILPGDRIVAVNGERLAEESLSRLVEQMRGRPGTRLTLTIRRRGHNKPLEFELERRVIEVASIATRELVERIGYVRVKQFQHGTHRELLDQVSHLREQMPQGLAGVVLDLRNNPGGLVLEAAAVADEFLDGGQVYSTRSRGRIVDDVSATTGGALHSEPCVVLVNEFSASAAELVAGALQDQHRATVVGSPTFGKGSVQTLFTLPDETALRLTTMRYYTPAGHSIQARGIHPDVLVEAGYVKDTSFRVVREADLDNHLPAEPAAGAQSPRGALRPGKLQEEEPGLSPTHLGVARQVPRDPTNGPDFALSIGFQVLRARIAERQR